MTRKILNRLSFVLLTTLVLSTSLVNVSFSADAKEEFIVPVFATTAKSGDIKETLKLNGTVYSMNSVKLSSKSTGQVKNIFYDEGEVVKKGDVLLKIDAEKVALRLKQAEEGVTAAGKNHQNAMTAIKLEEEQTDLQITLATSNLEAAKAVFDKAKAGARAEEKNQAEAGMLSAEAAMKNAEANFARIEKLYNKKTVSKQQYDLEMMQYDVAKAQYNIAKENNNLVQAGLREEDKKAAEANYNSAVTALKIAESLKLKLDLLRNDVDAAESNLKQAKYEKKIASIMLDDTLVRAPINGVISNKYIEEGEVIQAPGIPLFTLLDQGAMKIKVNIPETQISRVKIGLKTLVDVDSFPGKKFTGTITRLGAALDVKLRTLAVEVTIPNEEGLLKEGMFARVAIYTNIKKSAVIVPISAVVNANGEKYVFTVNSDHPKKNKVKAGITEGENIEIISGIKAGDQVIYRGNSRLEESMKIRVENK